VGGRDGGQRDRQLALSGRSIRCSLIGAGRVAFVLGAAAERNAVGIYAVSKAALGALARTYATETVNTSNVRVVHNWGPLRTRIAHDRHARRRSCNAARRKNWRQNSRDLFMIGPRREALRLSNGSILSFKAPD
jgi:NAD(P)-dependent dehydrogenase (short-subunit alcohol dehydrogenase family)